MLADEGGALPRSCEGGGEALEEAAVLESLRNKSLLQMFGPFAEIWRAKKKEITRRHLNVRFISMTVVKYLLPFSGFKLKSRRWPALIRAPKVSDLDRMSRKRRAEMFGLVFVLIPLAALHLGVTSPTVPTELAQSAWHPAADYLCGRRQPRCTGAGGRIRACS